MEALTENERDLRVLRLLELIAHINETIHRHQQQPEPDAFMLAQYKDRRAQYLDKLTELMGEGYELRAEFRPLDQKAA
jgi:hypothetical protein